MTTESANPSPVLRPWDAGQAVAELQELLCAHGFPLRIDGDFGSKTETAVKFYQKQHGLRIDGIVDAGTWASLKATVKPGARFLRLGRSGADVLVLQKLLCINGFEVLRDGYFGQKTQEAVMAFQREHQLRPDGIVNAVIWTLLRGRRFSQATSTPPKTPLPKTPLPRIPFPKKT
jgi:peptidoglycan hydrolase-like protein with peptidoglycan-binding domain